MADDTGSIASILNELVQTCKDGEHGFQSAARLIEDSNLRRLFESYAQQRAEFAAELELEVRRLAADPVKNGHMGAALHRSWLDIKAGASGLDDGVIISDAEKGESEAVRQYQEAVDAGLPPHLQAMVERQLLELHEAHKHLCSLERAHRRMA